MPEDERRIVVLPKRLVDEIDEHRGDMSRSEFIDSCIGELLRSAKEEGAGMGGREDYVTLEDFENFRNKVKDLLLSFLEFSSAYWAVPSRGEGEEGRGREEGIEDLKENVEEALSAGKPILALAADCLMIISGPWAGRPFRFAGGEGCRCGI